MSQHFITPAFIFFLLILQNNAYAGCLNASDYSMKARTERSYQLEQDIESYYSLIEESLHQRVISLELFESLQQDLRKNDYLSAANLNRFKQAIKIHLDLRQRLYQMVKARECWLNKYYVPMKPFSIQPISIKSVSIKPVSIKPEVKLTGIMLSLSAALNLYDNYLLIVAMFQQEEQLRRIIDQPDKGFGLSSNHLLDASQAFNSVINREKVKYAIRYYQQHIDAYLPGDKITDPASELTKNNLLYLRTLIEQSPSFRMLQSNSALSFLQKKFEFYTIATSDSLIKLEKEGVNLLSLVFGNTVGLVETRKGKLYQQAMIQSELLESLQPGDILLEKTPFRLTDQFIPGYWGHAAIWVGNEKELRKLDLWDDPLVKPWQQKIQNGHSIVEALRSGVELDPLSHFMNIDDMVVLRDNNMSKMQLRQVIINAFRQLGKSYDFNFDISTSDRIVCSELVYVSYLHINWPTEKTMGRYTISPDHIAAKVKGNTLDVISLYLNGVAINRNYNKKFIETLSN